MPKSNPPIFEYPDPKKEAKFLAQINKLNSWGTKNVSGYKRPKFEPKELIKLIRRGDEVAEKSLFDRILVKYYEHKGSMVPVCKELGVSYGSIKAWRAEFPEFGMAMQTVEQIIADEVHEQFMERVMTLDERNPAWKIFFLKSHDPRYADARKPQNPVQININIGDDTFRKLPEEVEKEIIDVRAEN